MGLLAVPLAMACSASSAPSDEPSPVISAARVGCPEVSARTATDAERQALFEFLVANTWRGAGCDVSAQLPPTCHSLTLLANGSYSWTAVSDYPERQDSGQWNFVARDRDSGTLFFSNGSSVLFRRNGGQLETSRDSLSPAEPMIVGDSLATSLTNVQAPELYQNLLGTCWSKTNSFDLHRIPDRLVFGEDGSYEVSYRNDACRHGGVFTVDGGGIVQLPDDNRCDLRGTSGYLPANFPEFLGDLLVFYDSSYRPLSQPTEPSLLLLDSWRLHPGRPFQPEGVDAGWGSVRVIASYSEPLTRGTSTDVHLHLENVSADPVKLGLFSLTLQELELAEGGFTASSTRPQWIELADLSGSRLQSRESVELDIAIVPGVWGEWVHADFNLAFSFFDGDDFTNRVDLIGAIGQGVAISYESPPPPSAPVTTNDPPSYRACGSLAGEHEIASLAFDAAGGRLSAGTTTAAGAVTVWDVAQRELLYSLAPSPPPNSVYGAVLAGAVLGRIYQSQLELFRGTDGTFLEALGGGSASDLDSWLLSLVASPDGATFATGTFGGRVALWRIADRTLERAFVAHEGQVFGMAFAPDGRLATAGADALVKLWAPATGEWLQTLDAHTDWATCVAFSEPAGLMVTGSSDDTVVVWNSANATIQRTIDVGTDVTDCALTPDATLVVLADNAVGLYRTDDGGGPVRLPYADLARAVAVTGDGPMIAVGGWRGTVELFCRQ
jgi:WD40 repeat protein